MSKAGLQRLRSYLQLNSTATFQSGLIQSVVEAGELAKRIDRGAHVKAAEGHRSVVTEADLVSNEHILSSLAHCPDAKFLCEEGSRDKRVLPREFPDGLLDAAQAAVIDSLDGTARFSDKYPDWFVAGSSMTNGILDGSAITAPDANGGTACFSTGELGVCLTEKLGRPAEVPKLRPKPVTSCIILRGVDTELYGNVTKLMPKLAASARAVYTEGSGLFGLMAVTLGRAAAIIQTPQKAWDWAPAYHMLTSAGGVFRFFRLNNGNLIPVEHNDFDAFIYKKENRLGFVAGESGMVDKLFVLIPKTEWERHDPDTI